jgi:exopolysaccharide production protein ExoZ
MTKFLSIQYLRGIAAIGVVLTHASIGSPWQEELNLGSAGVDIFFVISGFVMWFVTTTKSLTPAEFAYQRIARIVPIYWFFTLLLVATAVLFPSAFSRLRVTTLDVVLSLFFVPHYSPSTGSVNPILTQGWTLNYEMFFYALFTLFLLFSPFKRIIGLISTLGILCIIGAFYSGSDAFVLTYTNSILLEFIGGVAIGRAWELGWLPNRRVGFAIASMGLIAFAIVSRWPLIDTYRVFMWGIPAFLIVLGLTSAEVNGGIFNSTTLHVLGDSSYSIYLIHPFIISAIAKIVSTFPNGLKHLQHGTVTFILIGTALATIAGVIFYFVIEREVIYRLRRPRQISHRYVDGTMTRTKSR